MEKANGKCMACGTPFSTGRFRRNCDHCHSTKKVRGFVCTRCNSVLGLINDDETILAMLQKYITESRTIELHNGGTAKIHIVIK
jgi:Zn finger protein HypA/HybF involved in hydrogenase expression